MLCAPGMSPLRALTALLLIFTATSCGGKSLDGAESTGGTDAGGTDAGGTSSGGTSAGTVGIAGQVAGGTHAGGTSVGGSAGIAGSDSECTSRDDDAPIALPIWITNETLVPIHLGPTVPVCEAAPLFSVADAAGSLLPSLSWCRFSCQSLRKHGGAGCPPICPVWKTVTLEPGETLVTAWDGLYRADSSLPGRCVSGREPEQPLTCDQAKRVRPGGYTFRAEAGTTLDCSSTGSCESGGLVGGVLRTAVAQVELDARYGVLELQPEPGSPGSGAAPAVPIVHLVFRD